jgi:hypothetical protein
VCPIIRTPHEHRAPLDHEVGLGPQRRSVASATTWPRSFTVLTTAVRLRRSIPDNVPRPSALPDEATLQARLYQEQIELAPLTSFAPTYMASNVPASYSGS